MTPAAIAKIRRRRAKLVRCFNNGNWKKYLKMYADNATLRDPHHFQRITGSKNLGEYFEVLFEFAYEHGFPPMQLRSTHMVVKGKYIYDIGEYRWPTLRSGRYVHKWALIKNEYYLMSDRFTVE